MRASLPTLNALINAGARVVVCSHLGRPDGSPDPKYSLEPVAQRLSELLGQPVAFARDTVGESRARGRRLARGRRRRGHREPPLQRGGDLEGRGRASVVRPAARRARRRPRLGRFRCRAPQAGERLRPGSDRAVGGGPAHPEGARGPRSPDGEPRASLHGGARRLEGQRQARRDRASPPARRQTARRRRDDVHLPRGRGQQGRLEPARAGSDRHREGLPRHGEGARRRDRPPRGCRRRGVVLGRRRARGGGCRGARGHPVRCLGSGPGHRSPHGGPVRRGDPRLPHGVLERPHGRVRDGRVRRGHQDRREGAHRGRWPQRRRRWRFGGRRTSARLHGRPVRPHLHRWWGQPGVPRRQEAPRLEVLGWS